MAAPIRQEPFDTNYVKAIRKAYKDLEIERWVRISFWTGKGAERIKRAEYDLPMKVWERRKWVVRWKEARLICRYPKEGVHTTYSFYDKRSGEIIELNSCLSRLIAAKAQITRQENEIQRYLESNKDNMFFDPDTDEQLTRIRQKLLTKKRNLDEVTERFRRLQSEHKDDKHCSPNKITT